MTTIRCDDCRDTYEANTEFDWYTEQIAMRYGWKPASNAYPADDRMLCPDCATNPDIPPVAKETENA